MDRVDLMDQMDKTGAPVFALMGYAVASHVIPRGFAVPLCGVARAGYLPQSNTRFDGNRAEFQKSAKSTADKIPRFF